MCVSVPLRHLRYSTSLSPFRHCNSADILGHSPFLDIWIYFTAPRCDTLWSLILVWNSMDTLPGYMAFLLKLHEKLPAEREVNRTSSVLCHASQ